MNLIQAAQIAEKTPKDILQGARDWLVDLARFPGDGVEEWVEEASDIQIVAKVDRLWDGGWEDFLSTFPSPSV